MEFEALIGLEVHAELATRSKMFCPCPVVDPTEAEPNQAVCPVCAGMPGALPVLNQQAVELALRVALALECQVAPYSLFARKNYFYPDLPKGYQISQYEHPLARNGRLVIQTTQGERVVRIRRVHLEEDAGKLTHCHREGRKYTLVDLNRAGVPLIEIVSEPDLHSAEEVGQYGRALRSLLRYLGVNSGDMQKGVLRIEPNISVRPKGSSEWGVRTEIKNLNSFRALERATAYEIQRQCEILRQGGTVVQETRGWDEARGSTFSQRSKEEAEDYRYFPEPDLPPLLIDTAWVERVRAALPELPAAKQRRFQAQYDLHPYEAAVLTAEAAVAAYFERAVAACRRATPKMMANWIGSELFALLNQADRDIEDCLVTPAALAELVDMVAEGLINQNAAKVALAEMFASGAGAAQVVAARDLQQVSDVGQIAAWVRQVLDENPQQLAAYYKGKQTLAKWLFGQVMRLARGRANPHLVQQELERQLEACRSPVEGERREEVTEDRE